MGTITAVVVMTPDSLVLHPSRLRSAILIVASAGFVAGGLAMRRDGHSVGIWIAGFFGLCGVVGVVNALPSASGLRLGRDGFEVRTMFRGQSYKWADIESFGVASISETTFVSITFHEATRARAVNSLVGGNFDGALPESYGLTPEALAALLEDWRAGRPRDVTGGRERLSTMLRGLADSARSGGGLLVLKLSALFSFCGGPLFFSDLIDVKHRGPLYFAIPFSPILLLLFGAFALRDEETDWLGRLSVEGGLVGAALLLAMNVYAAIVLVGAPARPDGGLMLFGIMVGFCTAAVYVVTALRFLRTQGV